MKSIVLLCVLMGVSVSAFAAIGACPEVSSIECSDGAHCNNSRFGEAPTSTGIFIATGRCPAGATNVQVISQNQPSHPNECSYKATKGSGSESCQGTVIMSSLT